MNFFSRLSRTARIMIAWVVAICIVSLAVGLAVIRWYYRFEESIPFMIGIALGCAHSVVKVALMEKSLLRTIEMEKDGASDMGRMHFYGRYLLTGAVFVVVILSNDAIGMFGTIAGVLSLQIAAYITNSILRNKTVR